MSERLPYEEQIAKQWNELPLPDENMAWDDMKRRLDEDDDKPILPFWLRGCAGWGLSGLLLLAVLWWMVRPEKWFNPNVDRTGITTPKNTRSQNETAFILKDTLVSGVNQKNDKPYDSSLQTGKLVQADTSIANKPIDTVIAEKGMVSASKEIRIVTGNKKIKKTTKKADGVKRKKMVPTIPQEAGKEVRERKVKTENGSVEKGMPQAKADTIVMKGVAKVEDHPDSIQLSKTDTAVKKIKSLAKETVKKSKADSTDKQKLVFSAGIGLQQQLPLAGQKWNPYNAQGRKGTLADYIPSLYIRLMKPQKWFLQSEFRYGAPQYTKDFTYRQTIVNDTGANPRFSTITSSSLKKTYYHQLPVTFNYFIRPGWAAGAGIQWNKFSSAVSEKQNIIRNNILQQDSVQSKIVGREKGDTATEFKKSYLQAVIETQYQWKRFSFGARYSFSLQPYIQFTLPGGTQQQERNNSLQFFIRYELWKKEKK
jgi:hypothetical protein